jgi:hypothetical protein
VLLNGASIISRVVVEDSLRQQREKPSRLR